MLSEFEVTVYIDREIDIKSTKMICPGVTIGELKIMLAADDPTQEMEPEYVGLKFAVGDHASAHVLKNDYVIRRDAAVFELCELGDPAEHEAELPNILEGRTDESSAAEQPVSHDSSDKDQIFWEVIGGGDKGGIVVRAAEELGSAQEHERLSTGAVVLELRLSGERLHYKRFTGSGPDSGWVSTSLKGRQLLVRTDKRPSEVEASGSNLNSKDVAEQAMTQAKDALSLDSGFDAANTAFTALSEAWRFASLRPQILMARGLLFWRWSKLSKAIRHIEEAERQGADQASLVLLALRMCLSQYPEAKILAEKLGHTKAIALIDKWAAAAKKMDYTLFFSTSCELREKASQVMPGVDLTDVHVPVAPGVDLGIRLLLQVDEQSQPQTKSPLVLAFHREDESVESYLDAGYGGKFEAFQASNANVIVAGFRGFGFSSGEEASQFWFRVDGDRVCDALPSIFKDRGLPWPWPGGFALFGSSLGSRIACYLAGVRGDLFNLGVVLETAWCGSYGPNAKPLPQPTHHKALASMGSNAVGDNRFSSVELNVAAGAIGGLCKKIVGAAAAGDILNAHFCYVRGNEDLIAGYEGRLLILHGEMDHVVPVDHARRLADAAEAATRRLVICPGKRNDSLKSCPEYQKALKRFLRGE